MKCLLLWFCSGLMLFISCGGDKTEIEKISRVKADSIFQLQKPDLELKLDSLCKYKLEQALQYKLDSIVGQRKSEIIKLQEGL
ncbi:MAG: hypothetical protein IPM34_02995 [Saprospiraceae bacterium]|nr:hypothetical protein [Saprospiraceae bacterium]